MRYEPWHCGERGVDLLAAEDTFTARKVVLAIFLQSQKFTTIKTNVLSCCRVAGDTISVC